jgi:Methyltransferase domain
MSADYCHIPRVRWGHGQANHEKLEALIAAGTDRYRDFLRIILGYSESLANIPVDAPADSAEPSYQNMFLPGLDSVALYAFVSEFRPKRYIEIGSGNSTKFVARAVHTNSTTTQLISIDPNPRADIDQLCDQTIRSALEETDLGVFKTAEAGDILFFDGTHRCLQNSDVTCFFLEVLPTLEPGVIVHIHDIFLPEDYPPEWFERSYSEQYMLAVYLLAKGDPDRVLLPNWFIWNHPTLSKVLDPLWEDPRMTGVERHGHSFWFQT